MNNDQGKITDFVPNFIRHILINFTLTLWYHICLPTFVVNFTLTYCQWIYEITRIVVHVVCVWLIHVPTTHSHYAVDPCKLSYQVRYTNIHNVSQDVHINNNVSDWVLSNNAAGRRSRRMIHRQFPRCTPAKELDIDKLVLTMTPVPVQVTINFAGKMFIACLRMIMMPVSHRYACLQEINRLYLGFLSNLTNQIVFKTHVEHVFKSFK